MKGLLQSSQAFQSFSIDDVEQSAYFYQSVLELEVELIDDKFLHVFLPSGTTLILYYKPDHKPATYTTLNFQVREIKKVVVALKKKGVSFLSYGPPIETDGSGISWDEHGSHIAWLKDPGGNIIALIEN